MATISASTASPDVAIIGGGVAGSSLAIVLRRAGLDVHLVERTERFRDRIRGETIHPWGVAHLRAVDLYDFVVEVAKAKPLPYWQKYILREPQPPYRWADDFPEAPNGLGVNHVTLQDALIKAAFDAGAKVYRPASVENERVDGTIRLTVRGPQGDVTIQPRMVVGADGEHSATRAWLGGMMTRDPVHHFLGGALIRGLRLADDRVHQAYFEGGFCIALPLADDLTRVYFVCDPDTAMSIQRAPDGAARIVGRLRNSVPEGQLGATWTSAGPVGFFPNATGTVTVPPSRDVVLIGDASGRNDPSQGHGLSLICRDVDSLHDLLTGSGSWDDVPDTFHARKARDFEVLRQWALWNGPLATETGPEIEAVKARIARAREIDPTAGGFAGFLATGPEGLVADDAARRHFLGEDLDDADVS